MKLLARTIRTRMHIRTDKHRTKNKNALITNFLPAGSTVQNEINADRRCLNIDIKRLGIQQSISFYIGVTRNALFHTFLISAHICWYPLFMW